MRLPRTFDFKFASDRLNILMLFFLALIVRLIALERIYLISRDSIRFLTLAKYYFSGLFLKGLSDAYHPLYPLLISLFGGVSGDFEFTGKIISLTLSSFTVIFVYLLGKAIYDSKTGLIGGLFFIVQPLCVRCSVDVLSDSTFLFFLAVAFYLGIKGGKEEKKVLWCCLGAGICSGLAYLTRPEGIFVVFFLLGWYFLQWIFHNKKITHFLAASGIVFFAFFLVATPYILFIKNHTGTWQISMKISVVSMVRPLEEEIEAKPATKEIPSPPSAKDEGVKVAASAQSKERADAQALSPIKPRELFQGGNIWKSMTYTPLRFIETYHFLLFLFLFFGIWTEMQRKERTLGMVLLLFVVTYLVGLCYLYYTVSYVSRRHFLPAIFISLPIAGAGFREIQRQLSNWMMRWSFTWSKKIASHSAVIILLITLLIIIPTALKPQGEDKLPLKQVAFWIKANKKKPTPVIMSNEPLVGYYAGGNNLLIPALSYPDFVNYINTQQVDYLVFSERDMNNGKKFLPLLQLEKFKRVDFENKKVLVYEVLR
jgi:4-amino-4-deoxy-L-arabinose transferase-like glycosyltransferase